MTEKPVVFFHVMKCGGTSIRAALTRAAASDDRAGADVFELQGQLAAKAAGGRDPENWRFRDALLPYVLLAMKPAIVLGHFRYRDRYEEYLAGAHFVTVLRDPLDRLVSLYRYRRYKSDVDVRVSMPFDEFVQSSRWSKEGRQYVQTFCGRDDLDPTSEEAAAAAVANLRRFAVVGVMERLDDFAREVSATIGSQVEIPVLNRSPAPQDDPDSEIDPAALELARKVCAPDYRVYEQFVGSPA